MGLESILMEVTQTERKKQTLAYNGCLFLRAELKFFCFV